MIKLYNFQKRLIMDLPLKSLINLPTGQGKTIIGLLRTLRFCKNGDKIIVFTPKAKVKEGGWLREFDNIKKEIDNLNHQINNLISCDLSKINLKVVTTDSVKRLPALELIDSHLIFDECHQFKGHSKRGYNMALLVRNIELSCTLLSATPYSNGYQDMEMYFAGFSNRKVYDEELKGYYFKNDIVHHELFKNDYRYNDKFIKHGLQRSVKQSESTMDDYCNTDELDNTLNKFAFSVPHEELAEVPEQVFEYINFQ
ncbi:MAG: DEAD/DEAH box helicase family protein [Lachnospiraceae bacterium]|jgi:hypothetical protein|nr:DEAD/DEAH box helicase family protein [Lachnospiraceae bacterium]